MCIRDRPRYQTSVSPVPSAGRDQPRHRPDPVRWAPARTYGGSPRPGLPELFRAREIRLAARRPAVPGRRGSRGAKLKDALSEWVIGPLQTLIDPRAQNADLCGGEVRAHRWHEFLVEAGHQADQAAPGALAGQDVHPGGAALERGCLLVEPQSAHLLQRAVADQAALSQQRLDIAGEFDLDPGGGR